MNFKRGFYRLWAALSLLWISVIGYAAYQSSPDSTQSVVLRYGKFEVEYSATASKEKIREFLVSDQSLNVGIAPAARGALADDALRNFNPRSRFDAIEWAVPVAFGPPLFLLIIGSIIGWIASGFRSSKNTAQS